MSILGQARGLYAWEINEASKVFKDRLDYTRVRVHELAIFPDFLDKYSRKIRKMPRLEQGRHNAMTIGNHCFFPVCLPETLPAADDALDYTTGWLIHELTHAWQFQTTGWKYIFQALGVQFRQKGLAYEIPDPAALTVRHAEGWRFSSFSVEQQGELARHFYYAQRDRESNPLQYQAFLSFIQDMWNES
jgi:hypothetical protein